MDFQLPLFDFSFEAFERFDENFDVNDDILSSCFATEPIFLLQQNSDKNQNNQVKIYDVVAKKARFCDANEEEISELVDNAQSKATKRTTIWAVSVFEGMRFSIFIAVTIQHVFYFFALGKLNTLYLTGQGHKTITLL